MVGLNVDIPTKKCTLLTNQKAPWSTSVGEYKEYNGIKLASYGEAHWSLPEGEFCYG